MLFKELVPVALILAMVSPSLSDVVFGVAVDNTGAAFAVNKMSCRDKLSSRLLQQLSSDLDRPGHTALAAHIRRHRNQHADDLSHALLPGMWGNIERQQRSRSARLATKCWFFPFVIQCLISGSCFTGLFRMRRLLFTSGSSTHP